MVRTRSTARKGRPSKTKGARQFKAAPPSPKLDKSKTSPKVITGETAPESLLAIRRAEEQLAKAESKYDGAKVLAREAKAEKERLRERLHEVIREETGLDPGLYSAATKAAVASLNGTGHADDESWRSEPLKRLAIPKGALDKLKESNIETIGDLVDFQDPAKNNGHQNRLDQIKGIKEAAIEHIDKAMDSFWADRKQAAEERREQAKEVVEEVAESTDDSDLGQGDA